MLRIARRNPTSPRWGEVNRVLRPAAIPPKLKCAQSWGITCAQIAIIPTNNVIDASAAASSTKIFNMALLLHQNIERTLFSFCSKSQAARRRARLALQTMVNSMNFQKKKAPAGAGAFTTAPIGAINISVDVSTWR
jgi:hypothetical protein